MKQLRVASLGLVFLVLTRLVVPAEYGSAAPYGAYRIVGYFTSWSIYERQYLVSNIPGQKLTHINYAFFNVSEEGTCILGDAWADTGHQYGADSVLNTGVTTTQGNIGQLQQLKAKYPHLKLIMSVGGWTWSDRFSDAAFTAETRRVFAQSCVTLMKTYGFDGLDIDWEFPVDGGLSSGRPEDKANFTLLLAELRQQLDIQAESDGTEYLLTIAAPATAQFYAHFELDVLHPYVDWINIMSYTFHGGWSPVTNLHNALYAASADPSEDDIVRQAFNVNAAVNAYLTAGVPADKLVVGVPFYGHGWSGVNDTNHGLYQEFAGLPDATWGDGVYDYRDLAANYLDTYTRYWHKEALVPWLYDPVTAIMISYEDPQSLRAKADYVREQGLGGLMIWELSYDDADHTLLETIYTTLNGSP